jgi:hypothetical protein
VSFVTKDARQMWSSPDGLTHRHAVGEGDNLYMRRIAANVLNEQLRTAPNLGAQKIMIRYVTRGLRFGKR